MAASSTILLAVRMLGYQGGQIVGNRWLPLVEAVRAVLDKVGFEQAQSRDDLLLFAFPDPASALAAFFDAMKRAREEHGWKEEYGTLPVQIVLHLLGQKEEAPELLRAGAAQWDMLQLETVYITRPLMRQWEELTVDREMPEYVFKDEGGGIYQMSPAGSGAVRREELFPYRGLPLRGKERPCYYCGMTNHVPSSCPSKLVDERLRAIDLVGYLPFSELRALYKKVFPNYASCLQKIAAGVKPPQLRKDHELLVLVAYLDLFFIYQVRFLQHIAFVPSSKWDDVEKIEKTVIDNRNLHLGFDCLRVGQYERAENLLERESRRRDGKQCFALIGLAFRALELGRDKDMSHFLERAKNIASTEKERLYVHLLLSRNHELRKDSWKAKDAIAQAEKICGGATACLYRKIQYNVFYGVDEGDFNKLRSLMVGQKEIFMAALLDPLLLGIHGLINDVAVQHLRKCESAAEKNLQQAESELAEMAFWLDENDPLVKENGMTVQRLREQFARRGYYDLLEVDERARGMVASCERIRKARLDDALRRKRESDSIMLANLRFWQSYILKRSFGAFPRLVEEGQKELADVQGLLDGNPGGSSYREAVAALDRLVRLFSEMSQMREKMVWVAFLFKGLKIFVKNVIICELAFLVAGLLFFLIVPASLPVDQAELAKMMGDPQLRKKSLSIAALFLAPGVATAWTVWMMRDGR